jgi:uncharacterized membrane protein
MKVTALPLIGFMLGLIFISSCKHDPPPSTTGDICFESEILPIFVTRCAVTGCHDANTAAEGIVLDSYSNIMAVHEGIVPYKSDESEVVEAIFETDGDKMMPPSGYPPLTDVQKSLIVAWINEGAPNTTGCGTPANCSDTAFAFTANVRPIIDSYCNSCHSGSNPSGGLNFSNHSGLAAVALDGRLMGALDHQNGFTPMPSATITLDSCYRNIVRQWVNAGALDN